jgi:hypothetical protein
MSDDTLPRGIWYEAPKRRFRVRKYHNKVAYLKGYYRTFDEAKEALSELESYLATIPKERKKREARPVSEPTLAGTADAIRDRQESDPDIMSRR